MIGLIYPECQAAPQTSLLNDKEMVMYHNLYSHFCINLTKKQAQTYAIMYVLKQKYHNLTYSTSDEHMLTRLLAGK